MMKTNMQVKQIAKPVIQKRTGMGQAFDEMFKTTFPINYWAQTQGKKK